MAERNGGTCDILLLNLDSPTKFPSRLPRPLEVGRRQRSQQANQSQIISPVPNQPRLKFPQLEMTKNAINTSCNTSKIPQLDLTFKNNIGSINWLRQRPKTSVEQSVYQRGSSSGTRRSHHLQQLRSIQGAISRRNSSEDQTVFTKLPALPAIGMSRPNTAEMSTGSAPNPSNNFEINTDSISQTAALNANVCSLDSEQTTEMILEEQIDDSATDRTLNVETDLDTGSRPLLRSETYDILPTVNEEDDYNDDEEDNTETNNSESEQDSFTDMQITPAAVNNSNDNEGYGVTEILDNHRSSAPP